MLLVIAGPPAAAQRLPLPPDEQAAVDRAIERGVRFLRATAQKNGSWARFNGPHPLGYAALPGLTLLECDVPADDPILQRTAHCLRVNAAKLDATYELSLAILFLDRLGDPKDRKLIQTFALRLVAGQSATGGWGYKCPLLGPHIEKELLTVLRHLNPPPGEMPEIIAGHAPMPEIAQGKDRQPGDLDRPTEPPAGQPLNGTPTQSSPTSPSETTTTHSPGSSLGSEPSSADPDPLGSSKITDVPSDRPAQAPDRKDPKAPPEQKLPPPPPPLRVREEPPPEKKRKEDGEAKPFVIPERFHRLAVVQDPATHVLIDPLRKSHDLFLTTTDNSNTQFAILALWTAQRHDIPMARSLRLIVRRYLTSQNGDGSWSYRYRYGGGGLSRPPMTCVGLIGLAVGHGLAKRGAGGKVVQDPRILNGFAALSRDVGTPAERLMNLPMQNLYFMWSLERVAVLYNLPRIGDKDWYRWGAQTLVANQTVNGNWVQGRYPGSHPVIDTCLALLFLKRANLVKDLTSRLPFEPDELNRSVMAILAPAVPQRETPPPPEKTTSLPAAESSKLPAAPREESPVQAPPVIATPQPAPAPTLPETNPVGESREGNGKKKWALVALALFVVLTGCSLALLLLARQRQGGEQGKSKRAKGAPPERKRKATESRRES